MCFKTGKVGGVANDSNSPRGNYCQLSMLTLINSFFINCFVFLILVKNRQGCFYFYQIRKKNNES